MTESDILERILLLHKNGINYVLETNDFPVVIKALEDKINTKTILDDIRFGVVTGAEVMGDSNRMYVNIVDGSIICGRRIAYFYLPENKNDSNPPVNDKEN